MSTKIDEKSSVDEKIDVGADEKNEDKKTHKACEICNPPIILGASNIRVTLCGKRIVNRKYKWGIRAQCKECNNLMWKHVLDHLRHPIRGI